MPDCKILKVKIGLKPGRGHLYPDFNSAVPLADRNGVDWTMFIDQFGGWHYDQVAGHADHDPSNDSPRGTWIGMFCVPPSFADAAVAAFPDQCSFLNETQAKAFYQDRAHKRDPIVIEKAEILQKIANKRALGLPEDDDDREALDPSNPTRGRITNTQKTWAQYKARRGIRVAT
jgi:hypothetical protein